MVVNAADTHIHSFTDQLFPLAVERQMGIICMKVPARGCLFATWTPPSFESQQQTWEGSAIATRPGVLTMRDAMQFTLTHPVSTVIIGCDTAAQLVSFLGVTGHYRPDSLIDTIHRHPFDFLVVHLDDVFGQADVVELPGVDVVGVDWIHAAAKEHVPKPQGCDL